MAVPNQILQTVQTYNMSNLAFLLNYGCFVSTSNKKFKDFDKLTANRGDTVTFELPPRMIANDGLVATNQAANQRLQSLTVDKSSNVAYAFTSQQFIFNARDYMERWGKAAVSEIANKVESDVARLAETNTYRFFGDGLTQISSYGQLANMLAQYRTYGSAKERIRVYLSDLAVPQIVNSGLNQFVMKRNEKEAMSWEVGSFNNADFYQTNLLPIHVAGTTGEQAQTLTVVSTNDPTGNNITQITLSGATPNDPDAIKLNDSLQFNDSVVGQPDLRYLTFVGHIVSGARVQVRATADAAADGAGNVIVNITPALSVTAGNNLQNINNNIVAGMQMAGLPSHRCGLIVGGDALYLGMPQLPNQEPFPSANQMDSDTGCSLRMTHGAVLGQNEIRNIHDIIWGSTLPDEYAMKIAFPL